MADIRIGQGFDLHRLTENRKLILGGVEIPYELGLLGYSDADVLIHFSKGGMLSLLPDILPEYEHVILSTVYEEIHSIRNQVDNQVRFLRNITLEQFIQLVTC